MEDEKKAPWWIKKNKINPGLNAMTGKKHSEETKRKIGLKSIGRQPMLGKHHTQEAKEKISLNHPDNSFEKNPMWKGDDVGYGGVHNWIIKKLGQPKKCDICGMCDKKKVYEWSNKSRTYKRRLSDWQRLCVSCHRKYDYSIIREVKKSKPKADTKLLQI